MKLRVWMGSAVMAASALLTASPPAGAADVKEQFFPMLVYRTGPYALNGTLWANGKLDYLKMINARDGGVNGVKLTYEECEFGYATDKGIECYERLKGKGATIVDPQSTGVTFALTDKMVTDQVPLLTLGYGLSASEDGGVFKWNFPIMGSYWTAADILIQHIGKLNGGLDKLKGKKIALAFLDAPYGKEPIPLLEERAKMHGFELLKIPVTAPGLEQKSVWLQVRQQRPDYVLIWGWGVMNSTALKEAQATGYPRDKMLGVWWSGAEPDVKDVGEGAKGYSSLALHSYGQDNKVMQDIVKYVYDKGQGSGPREDVGSILYTRGMLMQVMMVEGLRRAQERFGKGKVMSGDQMRWGMENLALDDKKLASLGLTGVIRPVSTSCNDHMGSTWARMQTWDGKKWNIGADWYQADEQILKPMVRAAADKFAIEKKLTRRSAQDCQS